jgi:hypothetical protein
MVERWYREWDDDAQAAGDNGAADHEVDDVEETYGVEEENQYCEADEFCEVDQFGDAGGRAQVDEVTWLDDIEVVETPAPWAADRYTKGKGKATGARPKGAPRPAGGARIVTDEHGGFIISFFDSNC